jgi:D-glycero-D-manno-heptose 1,7-bisphosphate phosphatase
MTSGTRLAVFLDRDGVLNRSLVRGDKPCPPRSLEELEILPGVLEALQRLRQGGFLLLVVTNQPDVARGTQTRAVVETINATLREALPLDDVFTCYDDGDSPRRKPNPGMILEGAERYGVDLRSSFLIGDRWKDVEAGRRAGCRTILLDCGPSEPEGAAVLPNFAARDIGQATEWILAQSGLGPSEGSV